jgi:ParB-like chromosome segregation protein Spo0J
VAVVSCACSLLTLGSFVDQTKEYPVKKSLQVNPELSNVQRAIDRKLGPIVNRKAESLRPYPGNPRKHPEEQIVKLMASISHFGFALPVLVSEDNEIIAGEARIKAAMRLGMTEVPVKLREDSFTVDLACALLRRIGQTHC